MKILVALLAVLVLLLATGVVALDRYVQSAAFRQAVVRAAQDALGAEVRIESLTVSWWSGASLRRIAVAGTPGFPGDLMTAESLLVRYRLWPLLRRRLEVHELSLERPAIQLVRGAGGQWNYERLGVRAPPEAMAPQAPARGTTGEPAPVAPVAPPLDVVLPRLTIASGKLAVLGERGRPMARAEGVDVTTALRWEQGSLTAEGETRMATLAIGDRLHLRQLRAPLHVAGRAVRLAPLAARLAEGEVEGELDVRLAAAGRYAARLRVRDVEAERLLAEAGAPRRAIRGKLRAEATVEGTGGLATLVGRGWAELLDGRLVEMPGLAEVGFALQVPALGDLPLQECRVEFILAGGVMQTPVIRLVAREVQVTGHGTVALDTGALDHRLTLAVAPSLLRRAPREVRAAFTERPDGLRAVDFRMWGSYDAPRTDLSDRVLKGVTESVLRRGLQKLFR